MRDEYLRFLFERIEACKTLMHAKNTIKMGCEKYMGGKISGYGHARLFYNDLLKKQNPDAKELPCICCGKITKDIQTFWEDEEYPFCSDGCIELYYDEGTNLKEDARDKLLEERNNPAWYDA